MAEVQTSTQSGELSQRFIEFVMMHAQNAALFLGQIPNPKTGEGEVNLELAKMFIDQLAMIQEKTRGNLTNEESTVLRNALYKSPALLPCCWRCWTIHIFTCRLLCSSRSPLSVLSASS